MLQGTEKSVKAYVCTFWPKDAQMCMGTQFNLLNYTKPQNQRMYNMFLKFSLLHVVRSSYNTRAMYNIACKPWEVYFLMLAYMYKLWSVTAPFECCIYTALEQN